jgi:hypothetical protein
MERLPRLGAISIQRWSEVRLREGFVRRVWQGSANFNCSKDLQNSPCARVLGHKEADRPRGAVQHEPL